MAATSRLEMERTRGCVSFAPRLGVQQGGGAKVWARDYGYACLILRGGATEAYADDDMAPRRANGM